MDSERRLRAWVEQHRGLFEEQEKGFEETYGGDRDKALERFVRVGQAAAAALPAADLNWMAWRMAMQMDLHWSREGKMPEMSRTRAVDDELKAEQAERKQVQ